MDLVLADLQWTTCLVYLDDIIVFGQSFQEHLSRLGEVLNKLQTANLKVKPSKCNLFSTKVKYLGHILSADGVMADPAKLEAVGVLFGQEIILPVDSVECGQPRKVSIC